MVMKLSDRVEVEWFKQVAPMMLTGEDEFAVSGFGTAAAVRQRSEPALRRSAHGAAALRKRSVTPVCGSPWTRRFDDCCRPPRSSWQGDSTGGAAARSVSLDPGVVAVVRACLRGIARSTEREHVQAERALPMVKPRLQPRKWAKANRAL